MTTSSQFANARRVATTRNAATLLAAFCSAGLVHAANITWSGTTSTDFEIGSNWASTAPANDLTTDVGLFTGTVTGNLPSLSTSRSINGLNFNTVTGGWSLGSASSSNLLTIGAGGITTNGQTSGTNTISANLGVGASQAWNVGTGGTLKITGSVSMGTSGTPIAAVLTAGGAQNGTLVLDPSAGNSINLYATAGPALQVNKSTSLGSALNSTASTNIISSTSLGALRVAGGQTLTVNSGTWLTNDLATNSSGALNGNVILNGGTLTSGGGRYMAQTNGNTAGTWTVNGGTLKITGGGNVVTNAGYFGLGYAGSTAPTVSTTVSLNLQNGFIDVAKTSGGTSTIGGTGTARATTITPVVLMNQSGGVAQFGVTTGSNALTGVANSNSTNSLSIGLAGTATTGLAAAYTMTGGRLLVAGTLSGVAQTAGGGGVANFNFMGGTLTARTITATNLGSSSTATASANQVAAFSNIGTFINYGGTLAPGGSRVTNTPDSFGNASLTFTPASGLTALTGSYQGNGVGSFGTSTLAFNLGGTAVSTNFQDAGLGFYSKLTVTGTTILNDNLSVSLLSGFLPTASDTYTVLTSTGSISGSFLNLTGGKVTTSDGLYTFDVTIGANAVSLTNFTSAIPEPSSFALLASAGALGFAASRRRRSAA